MSTVSSVVHLCGTSYVSHDPHVPQSMSRSPVFTFFMIVLVTAGNLLQIYSG